MEETWFQSNYIGWGNFTHKGVKFLSLKQRDKSVIIYDSEMNNYGAYMTVSSFKKFANIHGISECRLR